MFQPQNQQGEELCRGAYQKESSSKEETENQQMKLRKEIIEELKTEDANPTTETIEEIKFAEQIHKSQTLGKHQCFLRRCNVQYK